MNTRRYLVLFQCMVALTLVFSGLHLLAAPRSVLAHVVAAGPQMQSHPAPVDRGGGIPFLATRLAAPSAAPIANPDSASTSEDVPIDINVLANDTGVSLTVTTINTSGTVADVTINPNDTIHYDPTSGLDYLQSGEIYTDTFQYTTSDITGTLATAAVTVTVSGANDPPVAVSDLGIPATEDAAINIDVLKNDTDPENDPLSITGLVLGTAKGTVSINNNTLDYDPTVGLNYLKQGEVYTDTFSYIASDGFLTSTAAVSVRVTGINDPPVAVGDVVITATEDAAINIDVLKNDTDPENDPLSISGLNLGSAKGSVSINNNTLDYDPRVGLNYLKQGQVYTDTFSYIASDGFLTSTAPVSVRVTGINDPPTANNDSATTTEDSPVTIPVTGNDTDPDGDPLSVQNVITPTGFLGRLTVSGSSITFDPLNAYNNLKSTQTATENFQYTISDGNGGTSTASVDLTINGVNDDPTPQDDTASTGENTTINISDTTVLNNDTDPEGDPLTVTGVAATAATQGSVSWNASSHYIHYNPGTAFDYLAEGDTATDTFQYTVSDGQGGSANATVTVTLIGANDNPTPSNDTANTGENTPTNIDVLTNDTDPDTGDTALLTVQSVDTTTNGTKGVVTINSGSKSVHYDPGTAFDYLGRNQTTTDTFGYTVSDGHGGTGTATVTVTLIGANDPPVAVEDIYTTPANTTLNVLAKNGVLSNDNDPDTIDTLSAVLVIYPSHSDGTFSLQPSGGFVYTPAPNYHGLDQFVYNAYDGIDHSNNVTVTIGVDVTNQPPVVVADTATTAEDTPVTVPVTGNDHDPDGSLNLSTLKVITPPAHGTTQVNTSTGAITYRPALNFNGTDTFHYQIYDQDAVLPMAGTAPVTVTVTPVNDPPLATDLNKTTLEDTPLPIDLAGSVSDVENDIVKSSLQVTTSPSHGSAVAKTDLTITYSPAPNYNGSDQFGYRICDSGSLCAQATINITVTPVNDPPAAADDQYYTKPISLTVKAPGVLANDSDVDAGDHLKVGKVVSTPINGELKLNEDGSFTYTPNAKFTSGNDRFSYQASDLQNALSNTAWVTITVDATPPNVNWQSPLGNGEIYYATSGEQIPLVISASDNIPIARVEFFWWDPKKGGSGGFVDIANLTKAPFRALINVNNLNIGWNQIFARAYDAAGNINTVVDSNHPGFIWIIRNEEIYLPLVAIGKSP